MKNPIAHINLADIDWDDLESILSFTAPHSRDEVDVAYAQLLQKTKGEPGPISWGKNEADVWTIHAPKFNLIIHGTSAVEVLQCVVSLAHP